MFNKGRSLQNGITKRVEKALDLPQGTLTDVPHIEINGRSDMVIEGCHGIVSYDEDRIQLNTGCGVLRISGQTLLINALGEDSSKISGRILSIEFLS